MSSLSHRDQPLVATDSEVSDHSLIDFGGVPASRFNLDTYQRGQASARPSMLGAGADRARAPGLA